jgi:hypothetical protein
MDLEKHIFLLYEIRGSESINDFQTWSSTSVNQSDSWKSRGQELSLLACQIAGTAVMGNHQRSSNESVDPQGNSMHAHEGFASSNAMLWQCATAEKSWPGMSRYLVRKLKLIRTEGKLTRAPRTCPQLVALGFRRSYCIQVLQPLSLHAWPLES